MTAQYHTFNRHLPNMDTRVSFLETNCSIYQRIHINQIHEFLMDMADCQRI